MNGCLIIFSFIIIIIIYILNITSQEKFTNTSNITIVSGYWNVKNKNDNKYDTWFNNSLKINQRYIFFCEENNIEYIKKFRNNYETIFIVHPLNSFYSAKYANDEWIVPVHVPSKELGMIWNEKMNLLKLAKDYDIKNNTSTDFYMWIDAGICTYRNKLPPQQKLELKNINMLPHDKICYSLVNNIVAGGDILMHKNIIDNIFNIYYNELQNCNIKNTLCGSDQEIFTIIKNKHPELFYQIGSDWGQTLKILYNKYI